MRNQSEKHKVKKSRFNIAQVSFIKPILNGLEATGCNIDKISKSTGLSNYNIENLNNYIPVPILYKVLDSIRSNHGIDNIAATYDEVLKVKSLSSWGEMIAFAPNVLSACRLAEKHGDALLSHETIGLDINGPISTYWQDFSDTYQKGKEQMDYIALSLALNGFKIACGEDWEPLELHFQSKEVDNLDNMLSENSNTKVYFNQPRSAIVFPTRLFNLPMLQNKDARLNQYIHLDFSSLSSKIIKLLDANRNVSLPNLQVISDQFNFSSRTLQRHLSAEDNSYESIIDQWRFSNSLKMIEETNLKIGEIAQRMGYANAPNFDRAFARWTGVTPTKYKEQLVRMS